MWFAHLAHKLTETVDQFTCLCYTTRTQFNTKGNTMNLNKTHKLQIVSAMQASTALVPYVVASLREMGWPKDKGAP